MINIHKIKDQIRTYKTNRESAKKDRDNVGIIAFCNGAIHELDKILNEEYK